MADAKYDVLGIGNAIFDVLVQTDEGFLARHGMTKGGMALIDEARAAAIYNDMGPATEMSGGSGANTIVGARRFRRARGLYRQGQERPDRRSLHPRHPRRRRRLRDQGGDDGPATGCSYILVTPDGERTMNTYLGAAQDLSPADIDEAPDRRLRASSISKAISGIRRTPRKPSSRLRRSRTAPAARWR